MTAELMPARAEIEGLLDEYATLTRAINQTRKRQSVLRDRIKQFMELEGENELTDGEHGITVRLQRRRDGPIYDVKSMPDPLVLALRDLAALNVDTRVLHAVEHKVIEGLDVRAYEMPGPETIALVIAGPGEAVSGGSGKRGASV